MVSFDTGSVTGRILDQRGCSAWCNANEVLEEMANIRWSFIWLQQVRAGRKSARVVANAPQGG
eukprot:1868542-Pyramimonas_sp.AAC.1